MTQHTYRGHISSKISMRILQEHNLRSSEIQDRHVGRLHGRAATRTASDCRPAPDPSIPDVRRQELRKAWRQTHARTCVQMSYSCGMTRTPTRRLAEVAKKVGVSEATVSRVLNGKAGVSDSHPGGRAHRAGRARLRAPDPAARRAGPADRPGAARAAEPDLPGAGRGGRRRAGPARLHPGAVHPHRRRPVRGGLRRACCWTSTSPASCSPAATSPSWPPRTITTGCCTAAASRSCCSTRPSTTWTSRACPPTT